MMALTIMRRLGRVFLIALIVASLAGAALSAEFWGSAKSDVYHYPHCRYAKIIDKDFLIKFSSPGEAVRKGYRACKVCKPPQASVHIPASQGR